MKKYSTGFSLAELIVIIVTIGILATIAIVSYRGIQNRAYDASVQSDLEAISGILESYRALDDTGNSSREYPRTPAALGTLTIKASKGSYNTTVSYNFVFCIANSGANAYKEYKLVALSKSGTIFVMTQDGFASHSLTAANITSNVCTGSLGMELVSNGLSAPNTWQSWVGNA